VSATKTGAAAGTCARRITPSSTNGTPPTWPTSAARRTYLIACGPDTGRKEYHADWTRRFFSKLGGHRKIHGFAAHYYCGTAGTATEYSTDQWYELIGKAMKIEDRIVAHRTIMDEFDPERKIGLLFDEWGTWHPPTPGRNPRHLWQQNTMRDAVVAAISLDAFHRHADKVVMANIAQTVNVLQALILTDGRNDAVDADISRVRPVPARTRARKG
jgi:alpha-N-arabinofuranosidase